MMTEYILGLTTGLFIGLAIMLIRDWIRVIRKSKYTDITRK